MKAAVVQKAGEIAILDLPEPSMGDYEARCEILCGSVCAGTDTHLVEGHPPFCYWLSTPCILGHESVGGVVSGTVLNGWFTDVPRLSLPAASSPAPALTETVPVLVPSAEEFFTLRAPPLMVVEPL